MTFNKLTNIVVMANNLGADPGGQVYFDMGGGVVTLPLDEATLSDDEISNFAELGVHPTQEGRMAFFV